MKKKIVVSILVLFCFIYINTRLSAIEKSDIQTLIIEYQKASVDEDYNFDKIYSTDQLELIPKIINDNTSWENEFIVKYYKINIADKKYTNKFRHYIFTKLLFGLFFSNTNIVNAIFQNKYNNIIVMIGNGTQYQIPINMRKDMDKIYLDLIYLHYFGKAYIYLQESLVGL